MAGTTQRTRKIRSFLLDTIPLHPQDAVALTSKKYGLSRQAINRHIKSLVEQGLVVTSGKTRRRVYKLAVLVEKEIRVPIHGLEEDVLWRNEVESHLHDVRPNVHHIWHYGFTEMVNNAIDHSDGENLRIQIRSTAVSTTIYIFDDGIGIFRKIQEALGLEDERHAILELSKGKLTTDPENHTGEGIFFASRMFDEYAIKSGGVYFSHEMDGDEDWILESEHPLSGTAVRMSIRNNSKRTAKKVFDEYTTKDGDYGFNRTIVPVRLLRHGLERLVSRSQAKRLLARVDRFKIVILDFKGVDTIGQAFADEIFRVFVRQNPHVKIIPINMKIDIKNMVKRASLHSS